MSDYRPPPQLLQLSHHHYLLLPPTTPKTSTSYLHAIYQLYLVNFKLYHYYSGWVGGWVVGWWVVGGWSDKTKVIPNSTQFKLKLELKL